MARFHKLTVTDVRRDTRDAVVVTLRPEQASSDQFAFVQGQYLTFRHDFDGQELRRSYSICAGLDDGVLRVGIKRVQGGAFSNWANDNLAPGTVIEAMPPMGKFHAPLNPAAPRNYLGFAGGSGITPVLSIIKTVLAREPRSTFTLVYANRAVSTIMFREELEDLKNIYLGRLSILHILETEGQEIDLFTGRIDESKMNGLFSAWLDPESIDLAFICGPEPMMLSIAKSLRDHGLKDEQIKYELFASNQPGRLAQSVAQADQNTPAITATVTLDGTTRTFRMAKGVPLLDAALSQDMDAPYACKAGVCSTCRAKITEGAAEMLNNNALEDHEVRDGYVLTCQCIPLTETIAVTYDI